MAMEDPITAAQMLIVGGLYLAPVVGLVWKASSLSHRVEEHGKDIDSLAAKHRAAVEESERTSTELGNRITTLSLQMAEALTRMDHMKEGITALTQELKELRSERYQPVFANPNLP